MQNRLLPAGAALALLLVSTAAFADASINLSHAATPTVHISITNIKGSVSVSVWDRNEIHVGGSLGEGAKPLSIKGSDSNLKVAVQGHASTGFFHWGSSNAMGPTDLQVQVPRGASLEVDVVSASLRVDGLAGGSLNVNAVSGRVQVRATLRSLAVDSVSGSIEQSGRADRADLQSVSGDILAPALGGDATLETVSGRIRTGGSPWRRLSVSSVSGDVQIQNGPTASGRIDVDSMSGDVQLQLSPATPASIHASSFSGELSSDTAVAKKQRNGSGSELTTRIGSGGGQVKIETFSGDVRIVQHR